LAKLVVTLTNPTIMKKLFLLSFVILFSTSFCSMAQTHTGVVQIVGEISLGQDAPSSVPTATTMLFTENNLRVTFDDNSTGSFAGNDWEIEINSSSIGGDDHFALRDRP